MPAPQINPQLPAPSTPAERLLTAAEFRRLADVPPEAEWFANITNPNSKRAYKKAVGARLLVPPLDGVPTLAVRNKATYHCTLFSGQVHGPGPI
jgi:hypothetical protein